MASVGSRKSLSEGSAAGFSYAQAAKGMSNGPSAASSRASSGAITPARDTTHQSSENMTSDKEQDNGPNEPAIAAEEAAGLKQKSHSVAQINGVSPSPQRSTSTHAKSTTSGVSSPDLGTSSASTAPKEDDLSSLPNTSSESTWENKSQTSASAGKDVEQEELSVLGAKEKKILQEAPIPTVNPWFSRVKAAPQPAPVSGNDPSAKPLKGTANNDSAGAPNASGRGRAGPGATGGERPPRQSEAFAASKGADVPSKRQETSQSASLTNARKHESVRAVQDQASWPTPEIAMDEEKKKGVEKNNKAEKVDEGLPSGVAKPHGKQQWKELPIVPTVVFNTPLPSASRRGGRGGARGASQAGGRGNSATGANGNATDREATSHVVSNGEHPRRSRHENDKNGREASPRKARSSSLIENGLSRDSIRSNVHNDVAPTASDKGVDMRKAANLASDEVVISETSTTLNTAPSSSRSRPTKNQDGYVAPDQLHEKKAETHEADDFSTSNLSRRASVATQTENDRPQDSKARRNSKPFSTAAERAEQWMLSSEGADRKQSYPSDPYSQQFGPSNRRSGHFGPFPNGERGGGRGRPYRGRGNNAYQSSHHANGHHTGNAHSLYSSSPYSMPRSPTSYAPDQAAAYFGVAPPHQPRAHRGSGRTQSIPSEALYGRMPSGYSTHGLPPIQTYGPSMYDYTTMQPMSASPYGATSLMDHYSLFAMISTQIEYYFSVDNLCKDMFLRKHMDGQGFVFLTVIADFKRVKSLSQDLELIKFVCFQSPNIEFRVGRDGSDRLRRKDGWEKWVLNKEERDPSVQNDGPEELHQPPVPHPQGFEPQSMGRYPPPFATHSTGSGQDGTYQSLSAMAAPLSAPPVPAHNGTNRSGHDMFSGDPSAQSFIPPIVSGNTQQYGLSQVPNGISGDQDAFSDEQTEALTVIVRKQESSSRQVPFHTAASRTFSNGSIDSHSTPTANIQGDASEESELPNGHFHGSRHDEDKSENNPSSEPQIPPNPLNLFWVKDKEAPVDALPEQSSCELYTHLRAKALGQREQADPGNCPYDMDVLYQFWSHFLIRNFNTRMYDEFRSLAFNDLAQRKSDIGLKNLIKYYSEALHSPNPVRDRVARHYVQLVRDEDHEGDRSAFKQLRATWNDGALNMNNRTRISHLMDDDLKRSLGE